MADINQIIDPKVIEELKKMNLELVNAGANMDKLIPQFDKVTKLTGQAAKNTGDKAEKQKQLTEAEKENLKIQKEIEKLTAKINAVNSDANKILQQRKKALQDATAAQKRDAELVKEAEGSYKSLSQELNRNIAAYQKLSKAERENAAIGGELIKKIQLQDAELKNIDATMGRHQRNVGNYKSGWNGLGNSINQLTREMPAFTYSIQTGFMALSNNIPIFADEINKVRAETKRLNAEGIKTPSVFSQIAKSLFSWQTAMSLGITLLTVYGKEIVQFIAQLFTGAKAFNSVKEANKQMTEGMKAAAESSAKESANLEILYDASQNNNKSQKERIAAVDELQRKYPSYFGNMSNETILAGQGAEQYEKLRTAIFAKAKAQAFADKIAENELKIFELQNEGVKKVGKTIEIFQGILGTGVGTGVGGLFAGNLNKEISGLNEVNEKLKEAINISDLLYDESSGKKSKTAEERQTEEEKLAEELINLAEKLTKDSEAEEIKLHEARLKRIEERKAEEAKANEFYNQLRGKALTAEQASADKESNDLQERIKKINGENAKQEDKDFETKESVRQEVKQKAIDGAAELGNILFDMKASQLQREFQMAEGNVEKQKEISKKIAQNEKKKALFDIGINTARAVMASLAQVPLPFGAPLMWLNIGMGAVQAAAVLAKPIPQFAKGTDYAPGGAAIVGEKGRELIQTPGGKVFLANNPALINLERGSKVLTNRQTEAVLQDGNILNGLNRVERAINKIPQPVFRNGSKIAERRGNYWVTYRNLKHRQN